MGAESPCSESGTISPVPGAGEGTPATAGTAVCRMGPAAVPEATDSALVRDISEEQAAKNAERMSKNKIDLKISPIIVF